MDVENSEFLEFVAVADDCQVEYILIGGLALILNGAVRFTQDADLWLEPTNENRDRFINALLAFGYDEEMVRGMREADFTQPKAARIHDIPMDVLTSVHYRLDYAACRKRAKPFITKGGQTIYFLHINDLRETKVLARRTKDLNDIIMIDEIIEEVKKQGGSLD
ncbi:DUF6036 family nucleotidyltransferase [Spirosoma sp. KUDC1026]|uniref:DUF6036 family nucleotidyltransferase n=1 Tax=Spirosoma sp. KUDC1026 TaxID=2745947 RepID=UPI00159BED27|nr:DUF6036 family nucleotidyltransferase [Spirosoma sp. KUDC1026]QKZ13034.1 hypothetical protein HU175_10475 [Spirosoma sp. KUDC1026]